MVLRRKIYNTMEGLVRIDKNYKPVSGMAESWE